MHEPRKAAEGHEVYTVQEVSKTAAIVLEMSVVLRPVILATIRLPRLLRFNLLRIRSDQEPN
jgi:hypothetical protein